MAWTYTPGGTKLGDRIMAMKPFMLEKAGQKYWNELYLFVTRVIVTGGGNTAGKQYGEIDLSAAGDVTTAIPRTFADPMVGRIMPGYGGTPPPTQVFIFQGFVG